MRFIHTGDFHLKMSPEKDFEWSKNRKREIYETFEKIVSEAAKKGANLLLIAGDMFHEQPKIKDLKEVDSVFAGIPKVHVVITAGNHDYIGANSPYRDYEWSPNVTFLKSDTWESVYFEDINTEVYGFSYHERTVRKDVTLGIRPGDNSRINILMVHGGSAEDVPFNGESLEHSGFDYVALGHIHKPDILSRKVRYCGSPEPLDRNETGEHGYILGEITGKEKAKNLLTGESGENSGERGQACAEKDAKTGEPGIFSAEPGDGMRGGASFMFVAASKRRYFHENVEVNPEMTDFLLRECILRIIAEKGRENYYSFELVGKRDPDITFDTEDMRIGISSAMSALRTSVKADGEVSEKDSEEEAAGGSISVGDIMKITDRTAPNYDFERLQAENSDNVVGMFIEAVKNSDFSQEVIDKALAYGMEALQVTSGRRK